MSKGRRGKRKYEEDDDQYILSNSEDEFSDKEKILLEKARKWHTSDSEEHEEEVYGLLSDEDKASDSDIEGRSNDEDDLPDVRAWGQKRKNFYSTDYVDQDYGGYDEGDVAAAELEEEEARAIQKRLAEQLDEEDFSLDIFTKKPVQKNKELEEVIKTDISKLTEREKLALLQKDAPEFFGLVEDFKANIMELQTKVEPVQKLIQSGKISSSLAESYIHTKHHLMLNYCTNIVFYLLLKAKQIKVRSHPIVGRLYQYRQLLKQLTDVDDVMSLTLEPILEVASEREDPAVPSKKVNIMKNKKKSSKKLLKFLSEIEENNVNMVDEKESRKEVNLKSDEFVQLEQSNMDNSDGKEEETEVGKRGITYQIAKNKGLTPHRKKEQRNPRVKHRNKFRKAKIRRKGQVREARKEVKKYEGEISGIKIGVVKSIKLK